MSKQIAPSLVSYFTPPEGQKGEFGLITGYSADSDFFNDALEKFTLNIQAQRAREGSGSLALMLDPNHPQISMTNCYGLLHLPLKRETSKSFNLLHAKVAILLFKGIETDDYSARLIVSTGNWTRQTLEDSLDLVWSIDLAFDQPDEQNSTDFAAAYRFLTHTLSHFDSHIFNASNAQGAVSVTQSRFEQFHQLLDSVKAVEGFKPRFFDNRQASLLSQLAGQVEIHAGSKKRNYLALGSGFYQGGEETGEVPSVIADIHSELSNHGLLTKSAEKDIVVNPQGCQAIAANLESLQEAGWGVLSAYDPVYKNNPAARDLHAKFIFSAKKVADQDECKRPWIYLGSGNLTGPGFDQKASPSGGNLEAGVIFAPQGLTWFDGEPETCISNKLPLSKEKGRYLEDSTSLAVGSDMQEHDSLYIASPIAYFCIEETRDDRFVLKPNAPLTSDLTFADVAPEKYERVNEQELHWFDKQPRQLTLCWQHNGTEHKELIPVIDEYGRIAASELPELDLDDAWHVFSSFPLLPADEGEEGVGERDMGEMSQTDSVASPKKSYYINRMMSLIELIAEKQTSVPQKDWSQWCTRLEQTFEQLKSDEIFAFFKALKINPLSPLRETPFRPEYAENAGTDEGYSYDLLLERLEKKLGLETLAKLGR